MPSDAGFSSVSICKPSWDRNRHVLGCSYLWLTPTVTAIAKYRTLLPPMFSNHHCAIFRPTVIPGGWLYEFSPTYIHSLSYAESHPRKQAA